MQTEVQHFRVANGLDILLRTSCRPVIAPTALIHVQSEARAESARDESCLMVVRLSPARLRVMLGNLPAAEVALARSHGADDIYIPVKNSALVRRVVEDIRATSYEGGIRILFLQTKILELLLGALSGSDEDERHVAFTVRNILQANPVSPPSLAELSSMVGMTQRKLNESFRAAFGMTVFQWLTDWRLIRSRDLVMSGDTSISEVANSLGYVHLNTFVGAFTRRFGISPGQMRNAAYPKSTSSSELSP